MSQQQQQEQTAVERREWLIDSVDKKKNIPDIFRRDGFVCLSQILKEDMKLILDEWHNFAMEHFNECFKELHQWGHTEFPKHCRHRRQQQQQQQTTQNDNDTRATTSVVQVEVEYALDCGAKNGFREVVMRSPGRYELSLLHYSTDPDDDTRQRRRQSPLPSLDPILNVLETVIPPLLEESTLKALNLCHVSILMATPGAQDQSWHADGGHVSLSEHLSCHCLNVFIPLVNVPLSLGPTEFRPGTQYHTRNLGPMMLVARARKTLRPPVVPCLQRGDVLVFDYRILHRGRANTDPAMTNRPILVLTFAKRWFVDVCNFPKRSMYSSTGYTATTTTPTPRET